MGRRGRGGWDPLCLQPHPLEASPHLEEVGPSERDFSPQPCMPTLAPGLKGEEHRQAPASTQDCSGK